MAQGLFGTRINAPELSTVALQPTGVPDSTYVQPQRREVGGNARALAAALGQFSSALQGLAQQQEDPNSTGNREWIAQRQQMSLEDLKREAAAGTPAGIQVRKDALDVLLSEKANAGFRQKWTTFYNTEFDRSTGDASSAFEQMRKEYAAQLPTDISRGNFYKLSDPFKSAWMDKDTENKVSFTKDQISTAVVDGFRVAVDDAINMGGKSAEDAAKIVFAKSASNRTFLEMSGQEQNDTIFSLAQEYALQGRADLAKALLMGNRTGADGKPLPALIKIPAYADKAIKMIDMAQQQQDENVRKTGYDVMSDTLAKVDAGSFTDADARALRGRGVYTDAQLSSMAEQSKQNLARAQTKLAAEQAKAQARYTSERAEDQAYTEAFSAMSKMGGVNAIRDVEIPNVTGDGTRTLTKQAIVSHVTDMFEDGMSDRRDDLIAAGETPEQADHQITMEKLQWYSGNGLENTAWSNTLNGIAGRSTIENLLERQPVSGELQSQAELYRTLKAANPGYLSTLLSDPAAREFLGVYDNAVTNRRMSKQDALQYAAAQVSAPDSAKSKSMVDPSRAEQIANDMMGKLGLDQRSTNFGPIYQRIQDMSRSGMTEGEITGSLEKELRDTSVVIHGVLVPDDRQLPRDFPDLVEGELKSSLPLLKDYGITDANDLALVPVEGQSKWQIVSKHLGMSPTGLYVTPASLASERARIQNERDQKTLEMIRAQDADRARAEEDYKKSIAAQKADVVMWENRDGWLNQQIAASMRAAYEARLKRDEEIKSWTPEKQTEVLNDLKKKMSAPVPSLGSFDPNQWGAPPK